MFFAFIFFSSSYFISLIKLVLLSCDLQIFSSSFPNSNVICLLCCCCYVSLFFVLVLCNWFFLHESSVSQSIIFHCSVHIIRFTYTLCVLFKTNFKKCNRILIFVNHFEHIVLSHFIFELNSSLLIFSFFSLQ